MNIDRASSLLRPGETAIALLTSGFQLRVNSDGSGTSGNWKLRPRDVDKVIIYNRLPGASGPRADIYLADYLDSVDSPEEGRYIVQFQGTKKQGTTNRNWFDFAEAGANPVRFLSKE